MIDVGCLISSSCVVFLATSVRDSGPEFVAKAVGGVVSQRSAHSRPLSSRPPWENGMSRALRRLRDALLYGGVVFTLRGAQIVIDGRLVWRSTPNSTMRPPRTCSHLLFAWGRPRGDIVAILVVLALMLSRVLTPHEALAGFVIRSCSDRGDLYRWQSSGDIRGSCTV